MLALLIGFGIAVAMVVAIALYMTFHGADPVRDRIIQQQQREGMRP